MEIFERRESEVRVYSRTWPAVFETAVNARQTDAKGKTYIDFFAGAGVLNFGHNNPRIKRAIIDYLERDGVTHSLDMSTAAKARFLQRFEDIVLSPKGLSYKVQFTGPTGSNAVEAALKLARKVTGRSSVVAFTNGFHGMTLGALACTGNGYHRKAAGVALDNVIRVPYDGYLGEGVDSLEALRRELADPSSGVAPPAAFIVETIQAEGGVNIARNEWLLELQAFAREVGALFIIDDIQVGCGRTGPFFSFEAHGLDPDLVCLAKGIGGYGLPLALLLIKPEVDAWAPGEHTGTFRGQCLSMVGGAEALSFFEDPSFSQAVIQKGKRTDIALEAMVAKYAGLCLRSVGMIHGLEFSEPKRAAKASAEAFERGLIVATCGPSGRVLKVIAPLTIEEEVLDEGLAILAEAVDAAWK